ncbi:MULTISPECIES: hypothetical protein [Burkholderia]|uniref:hypothetical protein n=1 Tax=Burkholderia TaxID=32008 RepID=UPI00158AF48D|nr:MULTISPECIES: hypothetical protein [Burkholderia]
MRTKAAEQELSAASIGVAVTVETTVHTDNDSKNYATVLATTLCETPDLAIGTREDMGQLITKAMSLSRPFNPARLSRALSLRAKNLVSGILSHYGYNPASLVKGLDIRDIVRAGTNMAPSDEHTVRTRFEVDGVWMGSAWYPYGRCRTYATDLPWYYLGIRFAGDFIPLRIVLAMRDIGVGQFIALDKAAHARATVEQISNRESINKDI